MSSIESIHVMLVQTDAVPGRELEFETWYKSHITEVLTLPGFLSASHYRRNAPHAPAGDSTHGYLAIYTITGDIAERLDQLRSAMPTFTPTSSKVAGSVVTTFLQISSIEAR